MSDIIRQIRLICLTEWALPRHYMRQPLYRFFVDFSLLQAFSHSLGRMFCSIRGTFPIHPRYFFTASEALFCWYFFCFSIYRSTSTDMNCNCSTLRREKFIFDLTAKLPLGKMHFFYRSWISRLLESFLSHFESVPAPPLRQASPGLVTALCVVRLSSPCILSSVRFSIEFGDAQYYSHPLLSAES